MLPDIRPGNTKILYFFNCLLDGMHTTKPEFCDFALWNSDCNLASSFSSKVVLSGRMERLAQRNKIQAYNKGFFFIFFEQSAYRFFCSGVCSIVSQIRS